MAPTLATFLVAAAGVFVLGVATDGGRAFTTEGARRLAISKRPRAVPPATFEDAAGTTFDTDSLRGTTWIVGFFYTQCGTLCPMTNANLRRLQERLASQAPAGSAVRLLSVSFDPETDTPSRLATYGRHLGVDPEWWTLARMKRASELEQWLHTFGIVVIPDGHGGFEHNAALHVVDPDQRLVAVLDIDEIDGALTRAVAASRRPDAKLAEVDAP